MRDYRIELNVAAYWKAAGLSTRAANLLKKAGIATHMVFDGKPGLEDIDPIQLRNCGSETAAEINAYKKRIGL